MFRKIYRMVFGKFIKSAEKISLFQLRAVNKVDRISKGEKTPVVHYPREEKFLKEMSKDVKIREVLFSTKNTLIDIFFRKSTKTMTNFSRMQIR